MAQSVARRLGKAEVGGSIENSVPSKSSKHSLAARCFCENRNFCLFIKEKAGISSPAEKGGKVYMKKLFALYAYNIGEKCESDGSIKRNEK